MKILSMIAMIMLSVFVANAQTSDSKPGLKIDKHGVVAKGKHGGSAGITKGGAQAKGAKGKGVEADKKGTRTTPAQK